MAALSLTTSVSGSSSAADRPVSKEDKKRAAAQFHAAEALFKKHAYAEAAEAFERANAIAPHPAALMNGVDAHVRAGQIARAANLCAQLVREAPADDPHVAEARRQLADLKEKVGLLRVSGEASSTKLDGKPLLVPDIYVDPGDHVVEAMVSGKVVIRKVQVTAGASARVVLDRPDPVEEKKPVVEAPKPAESATETKGLSPTWVYGGAATTLVFTGITVWSGLDTNAARRDFDRQPTQEALDEGKSKQTRTNVLLGVTAVTGLATVGIALFATRWGSRDKSDDKAVPPGAARIQPHATVAVSPAGLWLRGSFW